MIKINPDLGYLKVAQEQEQQIEKSRRLHILLAEYDAALRELEADITHYTVAEYNAIFLSIQCNRQQTREAIEALTQ